jgi:UDP:flavonoid glycosyltransferase YjiC (YdhE family)
MSTILLSAFGTAGDILPCMAVARELENHGHNVSFLTPRWVGLYPRAAGFRTLVAGQGAEKGALTDAEMYSTRFDGLDSWRRMMVKYIYPLLSDHYDSFLNLARTEKPDLIISTSFGYWGALAATELNIPWTSFHLCPQLIEFHSVQNLGRLSSRFARPLADWLIQQESRLGTKATAVPVIDWGISPILTVGPHDPAVVNIDSGILPSLGFPYDDTAFQSDAILVDEAISFLEERETPRIVVTLGSFIGLIDSHFWTTFASAVKNLDFRFLLVGLSTQDRIATTQRNVLGCGHLPLSQILSHADLVIHHGGIGSTYAALYGGIPSMISPRAFDQSYNFRLLNALGVATLLPQSPSQYANAIAGVVRDRQMIQRAVSIGFSLIAPKDAAISIGAALTLS